VGNLLTAFDRLEAAEKPVAAGNVQDEQASSQ